MGSTPIGGSIQAKKRRKVMLRGIIPSLSVEAMNLAEAWEKSLIALYQQGMPLRTEYDRKDSGGNFIDPPSKDATMMFTVLDPMSEPRFHRCFPGGPAELMEYRLEVVEGIHDHWMGEPDPTGTKWSYTYHQRLTGYLLEQLAPDGRLRRVFNQLDWCANKLAESPISRRIQAVTWNHEVDTEVDDPPCLQSLWFRIVIDDQGEWWLNMNVRFRSRDAYKAAFMNADAFIYLMMTMADKVSDIADRPVHIGRYTDMSDSYHIYGKDLEQFEKEFIGGLKKRTFEERTYTSDILLPMMDEAIPEIMRKAKNKN